MKKIILDTNFLTIPYQFSIDIFDKIKDLVRGEHEILVLDGTVRELKILSNKKGRKSLAARVGLELIEKEDLKVVKTDDGNVDDEIVDLSGEETIVATNDKELIKRLKHKNVKIIYLRGRNRLEMM
ncbi:MAG: hypothetical protein GF368_05370 [Candidatus Aenigmarchaeota archaeon]|nr:hypothetical protein [Candidatus Aenigmarchaeota archaeon]